MEYLSQYKDPEEEEEEEEQKVVPNKRNIKDDDLKCHRPNKKVKSDDLVLPSFFDEPKEGWYYIITLVFYMLLMVCLYRTQK